MTMQSHRRGMPKRLILLYASAGVLTCGGTLAQQGEDPPLSIAKTVSTRDGTSSWVSTQ